MDKEKKILFIYNPKAGRAQIRTKLSDILEIFGKAGYECTVRPTGVRKDAMRWARDRDPSYEIVVCSGGDGTLDETVSGIIQSGVMTPIGYLPAGSTNDFGGSLKLSKNMLQAAQTVVEGEDFLCDVGRFNEDVFVYVAAFGVFTDVSYDTPQDMKNLLGHAAYLLEGIKSLSAIRTSHMKIRWEQDGKQMMLEDDFFLGMVSNSVSVGGFKNITGKNVVLDDGLFEVTLIRRPRNAVELNQIITSLLNRDLDPEDMYFFRTRELVFESDEPVAWTRDGEYGGDHKKVVITNLQKGICIRRPR